MVGQVYFCYICFTKRNFSLIIKLDVLPCLILITWHVTWSLCQNLINRPIGGEVSVRWWVNEHFRCKLKLSTLLRLEWSSLISFLEDIRDLKHWQRNGTTTTGGSKIFPREGSAHVRFCQTSSSLRWRLNFSRFSFWWKRKWITKLLHADKLPSPPSAVMFVSCIICGPAEVKSLTV